MANVVFVPGVRYWWTWRGNEGDPQVLDPEFPPQLYAGTELYLHISFENTSSSTWYVLPWANIGPPSANVFGTGPEGEVKVEVPAGEVRSYTFGPIVLNELGVWQATFFLAEADTPEGVPVDIDSGPMLIAVVTEAPVDVTPVIGTGIGLVATLALMTALSHILAGER